AAQVDGLDAVPVHRDLHLAAALRRRDLVEPGQPMDRGPLVRPCVPELRLPVPFLVLLYSLLAIPFGQIVTRVLKYVRFRRRLEEMGVSHQIGPTETA